MLCAVTGLPISGENLKKCRGAEHRDEEKQMITASPDLFRRTDHFGVIFPDFGAESPQHGEGFPGRGGSPPKPGGSFPNLGAMSPKLGGMFPNHGQEFPSHGAMSPNHGRMFPNRGQRFPGLGGKPPDFGAKSPEQKIPGPVHGRKSGKQAGTQNFIGNESNLLGQCLNNFSLHCVNRQNNPAGIRPMRKE